jgi:hypothetical protein
VYERPVDGDHFGYVPAGSFGIRGARSVRSTGPISRRGDWPGATFSESGVWPWENHFAM